MYQETGEAMVAETTKRSWLSSLIYWVDSESSRTYSEEKMNEIDWRRCLPFIVLHLGAFLVFWVGGSPTAYWVAFFSYFIRGFSICAFYHRYFSHKAFSTSRFMQFIFAILGCSALQRGPLWWAAHHRDHHSYADEAQDPHTPATHGFWWSHMGWFMCPKHFKTRFERIPDLIKFPELRFLNRFDLIVPAFMLIALYVAGAYLEAAKPELGTTGMQLVVWGFFIGTLMVFHVTAAVNSLCHRFGSRRYNTEDSSRNNVLVACVALGEGWHNNHHRLPYVVRQGFRWYEFDITYYILKLMSYVGLIWDLKELPEKMPAER